jgi:2-hydroxy-3-keto-5-methylthiopentenyl-1-phosphate phosphatase
LAEGWVRVYSDFDGTIAACDVTDLVLEKFASSEWLEIQEAWIAGDIKAAECVRRQIALVDATPDQLDALLDTVELDPGFVAFATWCEANGIEIFVVSDGLDYFIKRVLSRHGFGHLPLYANKFCADGGSFSVQQHLRRSECLVDSGVCKCAVIQKEIGPIVYIGDGRSDACVSTMANFLFAKDWLATSCAERNVPYTPFKTFADVKRSLAQILEDSSISTFSAVTASDSAQ